MFQKCNRRLAKSNAAVKEKFFSRYSYMRHGCITAVGSPPDRLLYLCISEVQILIFMANYATVANRGGPLDSKRLWSFSRESVKRSALSLQKNKRTNVRHNNCKKKKREREIDSKDRSFQLRPVFFFFVCFFFATSRSSCEKDTGGGALLSSLHLPTDSN